MNFCQTLSWEIVFFFFFCVKAGYSQPEKLLAEGAIILEDSNSETPKPGTIRWSGSDFEGWNGVIWVSLTGNAAVGTITDVDGHVYRTIRIGSQEWMVENLRTTKYRKGTPITQQTDANIWAGLVTAAWCWYDNQSINETPRGKLYNWYAVSGDSLCPNDWHVPSDLDWTTLVDYLDPGDVDPNVTGTQSVIAGGPLKEESNLYWAAPNGDATNDSGFTALPGGYRGPNGFFYSMTTDGFWRSTTEDGDNAWCRIITYFGGGVIRFPYDKSYGTSVRCVKNL